MYANIQCYDCDDLELPDVVNNCTPEQNESQIAYMFISVPSPSNPNVPAIQSPNFSSPTIATTFVAPNGAMIAGIGDLPEPDSTQRIGSLRRVLRDRKNFTVNFTIDDTNDDNYDFLRQMECYPKLFIWYMTQGGKVYGDFVKGIEVTVSRANAPLDRGEDTYERFELSFNWRHFNHPPRQNGWLYDGNTGT